MDDLHAVLRGPTIPLQQGPKARRLAYRVMEAGDVGSGGQILCNACDEEAAN